MANRIKELRKLRGLTAAELARRVDTSRSQIIKLEREERNLTMRWMEKLAIALSCDPRDFFEVSQKEVIAVKFPATKEEEALQLFRCLNTTQQDAFLEGLKVLLRN